MGKEWPEHVSALDHAVIVLSSDPEFNSLCLQGVTLVDDTVLHVEFAGRELVVDLPKAAREAFRVELPFGNFREAGGGTRARSEARRVGKECVSTCRASM